MRKILLAVFFLASLVCLGQGTDPVLMTINGKPVLRSEFEYSYNKNGSIEGAVEKKSVDEYVDMFINYKLKVAAAEALRLDTLSSFRNEFMQYRDMQLLPYLVDTAYIDSVAQSAYQRTADQLGGKDMLRLQHILVFVKQGATAAEKKIAEYKIDSIYRLLQQDADFSDLARKHSQDVGSASRGGELPWIGPNMTLKEFEEAAYALNVGEVSLPVETSVGYHVIKMLERKQLEPYAELKDKIIESLKRQNIEEASAEHRIGRIVAAHGGSLTREAVLDSVLEAQLNSSPALRYLVKEYYDGLLLYEVSKREVWDKADQDEKGLADTYKANVKQYRWAEPRFKGFVIRTKEEKLLKQARSFMKKNSENPDWRKLLKKTFNKDSLMVSVSGPFLVKKGENSYIDQCVFKGETVPAKGGFDYVGVLGKKLKQPKSYLDVRQQVLEDYRAKLEKEWIEKLRQKFVFSVDKSVLSTVNAH